MRRYNKDDPREAKQIARKMWADRQIDKWCRWSFEVRGKIPWNELMEVIERYKINNHG